MYCCHYFFNEATLDTFRVFHTYSFYCCIVIIQLAEVQGNRCIDAHRTHWALPQFPPHSLFLSSFLCSTQWLALISLCVFIMSIEMFPSSSTPPPSRLPQLGPFLHSTKVSPLLSGVPPVSQFLPSFHIWGRTSDLSLFFISNLLKLETLQRVLIYQSSRYS